MSACPDDSIRMPAEWEPHEATWLAYPHLSYDWPGKVSAVRWAMAEFVRKLQEGETVRLLVRDAKEAKRASSLLRRGGARTSELEIHVLPTNRSWLRDSGPTFVLQGSSLQAVCWRFNAWGRYSNWQLDTQVGRSIAKLAGATTVEPRIAGQRIVLEGGAIECNGKGTVLTTEECLLGQGRHARNAGLRRKELESVLRDALGATNVLWLGRGIAGDDTSGHIDTLARFVGPRTVAAAVEPDPGEENHQPLQDNLERLKAMRDQDGRRLDIVELPMPRPLLFEGERVPATYANFYIANRCVLVPTFNDPSDGVAIGILQQCFPDREVCGIHCTDVAVGAGALHCLAQQQPRISRQPVPESARREIMEGDGKTIRREASSNKT